MGIVPEFDELYVISDLHLAGAKGFQIFGSTNELAAFIDWIRDRPAAKIALVINGDTVDFLAENGSKYFDPHGANEKLDRIVRDDSFKPVFDALTQFVGRRTGTSPSRWAITTSSSRYTTCERISSSYSPARMTPRRDALLSLLTGPARRTDGERLRLFDRGPYAPGTEPRADPGTRYRDW